MVGLDMGMQGVAGGNGRNRRDWREQFETAIRPLASSVTAARYGLPSLDNAAYRTLAKQAEQNPRAASMLQQYLPRIHVDAGVVIDLIVEHPEVGEVFDRQGEDTATFVTMPGKGFRVELKQMAERLAGLAVIRGDAAAAADVDEFLALAGQGQLPGYEVAVIRGLTVKGVLPLGRGAFVTAYGNAVERGLSRKREPEPLDFGPDHEADRASVVFREMTWQPCLVRPSTLRDLGERPPRAKFAGISGPELGIVFDFLSLVTEQRIELVEILSCAPAFSEVNPNFSPGTSTRWTITDRWSVEELTGAQASEVEDLLQAWTVFKGEERTRLELGLARLVSSIRRGRGRFWLEDRVLDVAVALEVLYGLEGGELTHKLSTRAAYLLGNASTQKRVDVFGAVNDLYAARSRIVHGRRRMDRVKREHAQKVAERGFEIGRDTLVELLNRGVMPDWTRVTLSSE